ncbi:MAG: hypothetical protein ACXWW8_00825 [Solirubrobacterales bacterium]
MSLSCGHRVAAPLAAVCISLLPGCGGGDDSTDSQRRALEDYVARVEKIRLPVNELLDGADPIMSAYGEGEIGAAQAQRRFGALERRFAGYTVEIAALEPVPDEIRAAHDAYAHTFVFEDAYLSALEAAIPEREFDNLPNTQHAQRAAIIEWRTRLQVLADRLGARLPPDIQAAGRGEIAPSPSGS